MTAIDLYLEAVTKRLWMRSSARASVTAELREHLQTLEEDRAVAFATTTEIEQSFGQPGVLAAQLSRSIRWQDSKAPWWFWCVCPLGAALLMALCLLGKFLVWLHVLHEPHNHVMQLCVHDALYFTYSSFLLMCIFIGLRRGMRPVMILLAVMLPRTVLALLQGSLTVMVRMLGHTHRSVGIPHFFCSCGELVLAGTQVMLLIMLAEWCRTRALSPLVALSALALLACELLESGLNAALLSEQWSWIIISNGMGVLMVLAITTVLLARTTRALRPL